MVILIAVPLIYQIHLTPKGIVFAVLSGAIASGIGYSVWYAALKYHTAARAAILQLSVPALAAIGGVVFLSEIISVRLLLASGLILGGIALAILGKTKPRKKETMNDER
jgi:drug/metabolite transporter (DMT)-like permease